MQMRNTAVLGGAVCRRATGLALVLLLAACAGAPQRPATAVTVPAQWQQAMAASGSGEAGQPWWLAFRDPQLEALVQRALSGQPDLRVVAARVAQARALSDGTEAESRPQLGATAGVQQGRTSSADPRSRATAAGLQARWELGLFGRNDLAEGAARADQRSAEAALQAARLTLVAEVASAYGDWVTLERRAAVASASAEAAQRMTEVVQRKHQAGMLPAVEVDRWRAQQAGDRAQLERLKGEASQRLRQLGLLLGSPTAPDIRADTATGLMPQPPAPMLPAELLERRPDVAQKASALDGALARLGVARREIYPRLQIDWAGRRERLAVQGAQLAPQWVVAAGVTLSMPLFDGGRIRANVAIHEARANEAMAEYEKALLSALVDAEMALGAWSAAQAMAQHSADAEQAALTAERNSGRLFDAGLVDAGVVLDAHREALRALEARLQADGARWQAAVALRRAFAGPLDGT